MTLQELHQHIGRRLEQNKALGALPVVAYHYNRGEAEPVATEALGVHEENNTAVLTFRTRTNQ